MALLTTEILHTNLRPGAVLRPNTITPRPITLEVILKANNWRLYVAGQRLSIPTEFALYYELLSVRYQ
jgi:hypothetical protein